MSKSRSNCYFRQTFSHWKL